ncbi:unnamed protein product [Adineta ricciae]|uniref:ATP-dependent DNA helicase n=1 Tax=Adineta ricciae TaxID=249248 RepID=A0A815T8Z8_ADIRI|nr:unnamed protein product [Adineta ricciae]
MANNSLHHISTHSWNIIDNIQILHECKKDRDEHLVKVITEAQVEDDTINPELFPKNQSSYDEYDDTSDSEDLLELLGNLNDSTTVAMNSMKRSTENVYIEETIETVEKMGRFSHTHIASNQILINASYADNYQQILPFVSSTFDLVRLNTKWQEQLEIERERVRRNLITGKHYKTDDESNNDDMEDTVVTLINSTSSNIHISHNYNSILPVASVISITYYNQKTIAVQYTLNREQIAAFMIITSHLDGDKQTHAGSNNGQLIMCVPGCGGRGKSQLIRAVTEYFVITSRIQKMRKLAPTGIAAAQIGGMTIHSFLGEQRNSGKPRTIKPGDLKLEKEWTLVEYLLIDEMSMVGLTLLGKLNRIFCAAKHVDPQIPFGGQCSYEDYELLLTRVVGQPTVSLREPPWNQAPMLVFRNEIRTQLNHSSAIHNAVEVGTNLMVCVAQDLCKGKAVKEAALVKKLLELSDSKTEHLPGLLPLVPGMPVIITQNIAIELGLINGVNGIFRQLVYDIDSVSTGSLSKTFPMNTQYVHKPIYALVEIGKSKIECNL